MVRRLQDMRTLSLPAKLLGGYSVIQGRRTGESTAEWEDLCRLNHNVESCPRNDRSAGKRLGLD